MRDEGCFAMTGSWKGLALGTTMMLAWVAPAVAGSSVMVRHSALGGLVLVTNAPAEGYAELVDRLKPTYLQIADPAAPKDALREMPDKLVFMLFVLKHGPEGLKIDPSWLADLPVTSGDLAERANLMIAARLTPIPGSRAALCRMLLKAPTDRLLAGLIREALAMTGDFPVGKPIAHPVADLRAVRAIACLPSMAGRLESLGTAAEAALYKTLVDLRAFQVVGREALPIVATPTLMTLPQVQQLGRDLKVQALAIARIAGAETTCVEKTEYKKSSKKSVSVQRQREYDEAKRKLAAEGKTPRKPTPDPDLVWAAPYHTRDYTTSLSGEVQILDTTTGAALLTYDLGSSVAAEEEDEVKSADYRWVRSADIDDYDSGRKFGVRLRVAEAVELTRSRVAALGALLATRAMLPIPGEVTAPEQTATGGTGGPVTEGNKLTGKILSIEGTSVYLNLGREQGLRVGDGLTVWIGKELKDPDTGNTVETIKTRGARLKVAELYGKTSRCEVVEQSTDGAMQVGAAVVQD